MSELSEQEKDEIKELVIRGQKIDAIKLARQKTGLGLKDAKEYVENLDIDPDKLPAAKSGCGAAVALFAFLGYAAGKAGGIL
jgi:hypothetical protein